MGEVGGGGGGSGKVKRKLLLGLVERRGEGLGKWGAIPLGQQTAFPYSVPRLGCLVLSFYQGGLRKFWDLCHLVANEYDSGIDTRYTVRLSKHGASTKRPIIFCMYV